MISKSKLLKCRTVVGTIRKETEKLLKKQDRLFPIIKLIDKVYLDNNVKRLFPTNVATGRTISHSHPRIKDVREGSVTIDHGFIHEGIKIDTAFTTSFSSLEERLYYQLIRVKYIRFIRKIREEIAVRRLTNLDIAILFDSVFKTQKKDVCKTLMGHRIENFLHEEPYLQMGLVDDGLLVDQEILTNGFYAIEIYFTKNLSEELVEEIKDPRRSLYNINASLLEESYVTYQEMRSLPNGILEVHSPIVYLKKNFNYHNRIMQMEQTFQLEDNTLLCISSKT